MPLLFGLAPASAAKPKCIPVGPFPTESAVAPNPTADSKIVLASSSQPDALVQEVANTMLLLSSFDTVQPHQDSLVIAKT